MSMTEQGIAGKIPRKINGGTTPATPCNPSSAVLPGNIMTTVTKHGKTSSKNTSLKPRASITEWFWPNHVVSTNTFNGNKIFLFRAVWLCWNVNRVKIQTTVTFFRISTFQRNRTTQNSDNWTLKAVLRPIFHWEWELAFYRLQAVWCLKKQSKEWDWHSTVCRSCDACVIRPRNRNQHSTVCRPCDACLSRARNGN